ncbi:MAG: sulfatase [Phycisphaerae bacterium]|nr:sulfatase [Phycisphaerae bacterium]
MYSSTARARISAVMVAAVWSCAQAAAPARLNVLMIVSEDHSPNLGCYGDRVAKTPSLDRLASQGVRFDRAYVTQAGCSQSRSSILTGLYPHQNGQIGLATHKYTMIRKDTPNLPALLKAAGYRTGIIGKLHINPSSAFPFDLNWNDPKFISFGKRDIRKIASVAGEFMAKSATPFFLSVNTPDAHVPWHRQQKDIPAEPIGPGDVSPLPWVPVDTPHARKNLANYYNCISRLDTAVGMLLDELARCGKAEQTLVIFLSDHGAQFSRGKMTCYEPGLRVPLIVRWPGHAKPGLVCEELVSTIDLMPTILAATGVAGPKGLPGASMIPLVEGRSVGWREYLFAEYTVHSPNMYFPQRSVRDDRYKLIVNFLLDRPSPVAANCVQHRYDVDESSLMRLAPEYREVWQRFSRPPAVELYDLKEDPYEMSNLADRPEHAATVKRLRDRLAEWQKRTGDPLADPVKLDRLTREHDTLDPGYRKDPGFKWKYPSYLY